MSAFSKQRIGQFLYPNLVKPAARVGMLLIAVMVCTFVPSFEWSQFWINSAFSSVTWKCAVDGYPRYAMTRALLADKTLIGLSPTNVLERFGQPDAGKALNLEDDYIGMAYRVKCPTGYTNDDFWIFFKDKKVVGCSFNVWKISAY